MYTKKEFLAMLNDMKEQNRKCIGFIVGMVTQTWVEQMIDEKIQQVMNAPDDGNSCEENQDA